MSDRITEREDFSFTPAYTEPPRRIESRLCVNVTPGVSVYDPMRHAEPRRVGMVKGTLDAIIAFRDHLSDVIIVAQEAQRTKDEAP